MRVSSVLVLCHSLLCTQYKLFMCAYLIVQGCIHIYTCLFCLQMYIFGVLRFGYNNLVYVQ